MTKFNEDSRVKIPAILHLMRLGYSYLSLKEAKWDADTNIFPDVFVAALKRINPTADDGEVLRLKDEVSLLLENEDLGKAFYERLIEKSGLRLIDFEDFSRNTFNVVTELPCQNKDEEFRPDITQARAWNKERRRQTIIEARQLPAWWQAVLSEPDYVRDFLLMALFTGMRRSELQRLRWENIDLDERKLHLPTTKNGDPLMLPLSDFLLDLLRDRKASAGVSPWVFPGNGPSGHIVEPKKFLQRVSAASGVSFTLHDLRRTYITIAESLDIPHYALKRLLNHRSTDDVTGGYIIINVDRLRGPVELISERILEMKEPNV